MAAFEDFFNAIIGQESGGNYSAVNRDSGALGFAQVMPANVGAWSKEILGYAVTPSQFLNSPELQEKIVRGKLKKYYDAYGPRGAASAWYSGDPGLSESTRPQSGYPSIKAYVDSVMSKAGGGDSYGYVQPTKVVDNRTKSSSISDLMPEPEPPAIDALSGADVTGLGLGQIEMSGLEAAQGGVGTAAPQVSNPATATQPAKPTAAQVASQAGEFIQQLDQQNAAAPAAGGGMRDTVIELAKQFIGTPYVWGGSAPGGFDCSGLIQYAMKQAGISFPRVSWDQLDMGERTDVASLQAGDLVGFGDGGHLALYLGGGQILEAPRTGLDVRIRDLGANENTWGVSLASLYK